MSLVSVIVPVFNSERAVSRCAESIFAQTFVHLEVIFVDDASTDGSLSELARFTNDPRCTVITRRERKGAGPARNLGLGIARGDYVCFVDSDDWIDSDYIAQLVDAIEAAGADLAIGPYRSIWPHRSKTHRFKPLEIEGSRLRSTALLNSHVNAPPSVCMRIYRRRIIEEDNIRFSDAPTAQDFEFNLRYMFACNKVIYLPIDAFYNYVRAQPSSVTNAFERRYILGYEHILCVVREYELAAHPLSLPRAFRCYELYTSCRKKIIKARLSPQEHSGYLALTKSRLAPLAPSLARALLILLTLRSVSWRYRAKKLRSVFLDPLVLGLLYHLRRATLRSRS